MAGLAWYVAKRRRRNRSFVERTRNQASMLMDSASNLRDRASKLSDSAAGLLGKSRKEVVRQKTGILDAIGAGKAAYLKAAG